MLFAEAWRTFEDGEALREVAELGLALAGSAERHAETLSLGTAFVAAASAWPDPVLGRLPEAANFPVAVGAVAAAHGVPVEDALAAYLHAAISQSVSAGIRLGVCGQVEGVAILAALEDALAGTAFDDNVFHSRNSNTFHPFYNNSGGNAINDALVRRTLTVNAAGVLSAASDRREGFFGVDTTDRPAISGSKGGNAALADLLAKLAAMGLVTDSTT